MERRIELPITRESVRSIKSGESLLLSGVIYTARDAAHKRLVELVVIRKWPSLLLCILRRNSG